MAVLAILAVSCKELPFETQILSYEGNKVDRTFVFDGSRLSEDGAGKWHVDAESVTLEVENPTYRDGGISVLAETSEYAGANPLGWNAWYNWPKVHVPAGGSVTVTLPFAK